MWTLDLVYTGLLSFIYQIMINQRFREKWQRFEDFKNAWLQKSIGYNRQPMRYHGIPD